MPDDPRRGHRSATRPARGLAGMPHNTVGDTEEQAEERLALQQARRTRRARPVTLTVLILLLLGVGGITAVDLRRLDTPGGAALSWTEAALFGECGRYGLLTDRPDDAFRTPDQACDLLEVATRRNQARSGRIGVRVVGSAPGTAEVRITDLDANGPARERTLTLSLVQTDRWKVRLVGDACRLGCF